MNNSSSLVLYVLLSILFIALQTTLISPRYFGYAYPDLNLILIVYLAIYSEARGTALIALGNGFMMDVLTGNMLGAFTFSRFSAYVLLKSISHHVYMKRASAKGAALFLSTIFSELFIWAILAIKQRNLNVEMDGIIIQAVVNTLIGLPIFWAINKVDARLQK